MIRLGSIVEFVATAHGVHAHSVGVVRDIRRAQAPYAYTIGVLVDETGNRVRNSATDVEEPELRVLASGAAPDERPYWRVAVRRDRTCWACGGRFVVVANEIVEFQQLHRCFTVEVRCPDCNARHEELGSFSGAVSVERPSEPWAS